MELEQLLSKLHDGLADEAEIARIEELLAGDPEACEFYLDYTQMVAALEMEVGVCQPLEVGDKTVPLAIAQSTTLFFEGQNTRQILNPSWKPLPWFAAAAAVLVFAGSLAVFFGDKNPIVPGEAMAEEPTQTSVAVVMESVGASYDRTGLVPDELGELPPGELRLLAGIVEIGFTNGVRVLLEAPAVFEIGSQSSGALREGRMRVHVSDQAERFSVTTPHVEIVDRGSEFGVRIGDEGRITEVHCFDGEVEVFDAGDRQAESQPKLLRSLAAMQAMRFPTKGSRPTNADPYAFISYQVLEAQALEQAEEDLAAWRSYIEKLRADDHVVALFSFDEQGPHERTLVNQAQYRGQLGHGAIIGARWTSGRWPSKGALEFSRNSDRVRVTGDGSHESLTLAAWVRVDELGRRPYSLLASMGEQAGGVNWSMAGEGKLTLTVRSGDGKKLHRYQSQPMFDKGALGNWHHIATVYDPAAGKVAHYLDGALVSEHNLGSKQATPLALGDALIGNTEEKNPKGKALIRHLTGRVDEFAILSRAFTEEEIGRMASFGSRQ